MAGPRVSLQGRKARFCHVTYTSHTLVLGDLLTSPCLSFLITKLGIITVPLSLMELWDYMRRYL